MSLGTKISLILFYRNVGSDANGNKYYVSRFKRYGRNIRTVWYASNDREPTTIPPLWHAWLHYVAKTIPSSENYGYHWQRPKIANTTGTSKAYFPAGHPYSGGKHDPIESEYKAWRP